MIFNTSKGTKYVTIYLVETIFLIFTYLAKASSSARAICSGSTYNLEVDILIVEPFKLILLLSKTKSADMLTPISTMPSPL